MASVTQNPRRGNIISRYVDPVKNARSMEGQVLMAETIAKLVAVVITSIGFFIWGKSVAAQYTDIVALHWATGILFAGIAAWITDFAFSHFLENSLFQFLSFWKFSWWKNLQRDGYYITFLLRPFRWVVVTIIVAALFWADWNSVYTLRSPIANAKKEKVERVDFSKLDAAQKQRIKDQLGPINIEIKEVRADIQKTEKDVVAANKGLVDMANRGNKWAPSELQRKKDKATKAARKRLQTLQETNDKTYASITGTSEQERSIAISDDTAAQQTDAENKAAITTLFTQFGIGSKILTILFRLFLIINFLINTPDWDANFDGRIDGEDVTAAAQGSRQFTSPTPTGAQGQSTAYAEQQQRNRIGYKDYQQPQGRTDFRMTDPPNPSGAGTAPSPTTVPEKIAVEQCSTAKTSEQSTVPKQPATPIGTSLIADIRDWQKRANQCYKRSLTQQREEYRLDNQHRATAYTIMLQAVGVEVIQDKVELRFKEPVTYADLTPVVISLIEEQKQRLIQISERRKGA